MATANAYTHFPEGLFSATTTRNVIWTTDTIKLALVTSSYTPDLDNHDFWDDVSANELATGNGYTTGGNTLGTKSVGFDAGTNQTRLIATSGNVWTFTGGVAKAFRYGVIRKDTGTAGTSPLIALIDFGAQSVTDTTFTATPDATGWVTLTTA
jgi:hypothetical protein